MSSKKTNCKRLLLIGGSGFIGSAIGEQFAELGWEIVVLTRKVRRYQLSYPCTQVSWDGELIPDEVILGTHAVINLAGQPIADKAWTASYRNEIRESRVNSTRALANAIASVTKKPEVIIQASAVGFFGMQHRDDLCDENSRPGTDFLAGVCKAWENEAKNIEKTTRLCVARIGLVLGWEGGAFPKLWNIYASGLGSSLGNGKQWMNWIHLKDVVSFFTQAVLNQNYSGVFNLVAPENIDNRSFHKTLADSSLSCRALATPGVCIKTLMGGRADLLLKAPKVTSSRLAEANFEMEFPALSEAILDLLTERTHLKAHYLKVKQWVPIDIVKVWDFVSSADNLEKITPPWLSFKIEETSSKKIEKGTRISYSLRLHGIPIRWRSHISSWVPKSEFVDEQEKGPYSLWFHRHVFKPLAGGTVIEDRVEYRLPVFPLGQVALPLVLKDLSEIFGYRKESTAAILCGDVD